MRDGVSLSSFSTAVFPTLSGDGSTLVYGVDSSGLGVRVLVAVRLSTGVTTRFTLPAGAQDTYDVWVSPTGDRILPLERDGVHLQLSTPAGTTSALSGPFSSGFPGVYGFGTDVHFPGIIAPSGRFAALPARQEAVLADLTGADIPGASDPLSGDVYTRPHANYYCGKFFGFLYPPNNYGDVSTYALLDKPAEWAPALSKANVTLKVGTKTLRSVTGALPGTEVSMTFVGQYSTYGIAITTTDVEGHVAPGTVGGNLGPCYDTAT